MSNMNGDLIEGIDLDYRLLKSGELTPAEFADSVQERMYPNRVGPTQAEEAKGASAARTLHARTRVEPKSQGTEAFFGIHWNTWLYDYAQAVSAWLYSEVRRSIEVEEFRATYLQGRQILSTEQAWAYLAELANEPAKPGASPEVGRRKLYVGMGPGMEWLVLPQVSSRELNELMRIASLLTRHYRASTAWALLAILAEGLEAQYVPYAVRSQEGTYRFTERVVLEVDPVMTPNDVRELYKRARNGLTKRSKSIARSRLRLVAFAARHPHVAWEDLRERWNLQNRKHPDRQYALEPPKTVGLSNHLWEAAMNGWANQFNSIKNNFRRDTLSAWRWVLGSEPARRPKRAPLPKPSREELRLLGERLRKNSALYDNRGSEGEDNG